MPDPKGAFMAKIQSITFTVLGNPKAKGRPKFARMGKFVRAYTPAQTVKEEASFREQALPYRPDKPIEGEITLIVDIYRDIPKSFSNRKASVCELRELRPVTKPDIDNYLKLICDALNGIFWHDDAQIVTIFAAKFYSARPRIEVSITYSTGGENESGTGSDTPAGT